MASGNPPHCKKLPSMPLALPLPELTIAHTRSIPRHHEKTDVRPARKTTRVKQSKKSRHVEPEPHPLKSPGGDHFSGQQHVATGPKLLKLNVVTNFSKSSTRTAKISSKEDSKHKYQGSIQSRRCRRRGTSRDGFNDPIGSLKRAGSKRSDLSPSDRTLLFGMNMPPESRKILEQGGLNVPIQSSRNGLEPTPSIIVTPAQAAKPWASNSRQRAVSSVYSQATHFAHECSPKDVPPLPNVLLSFGKAKEYAANDYRNEDESRSRVTSWGTEFDEDEAPPRYSHSRPCSGESQLIMLKRASMDTVATRRSRGWWNQIVSPFLDRSNTNYAKNSKSDEDKDAGTLGALETQFADGRRGGRDSIWTDISRWEDDGRTMVFVKDDHVNFDISNHIFKDKPATNGQNDTDGFGRIGSSDEYFEACWHDQQSQTAFFKCQNHDCMSDRMSLKIQGSAVESIEINGREPKTEFFDESEEIISDEDEELCSIQNKGLKDANNKASGMHDLHHSVFVQPRSRANSETTEIEDEADSLPVQASKHVQPATQAISSGPASRINKLSRNSILFHTPQANDLHPDFEPRSSRNLPAYTSISSEKPAMEYSPPPFKLRPIQPRSKPEAVFVVNSDNRQSTSQPFHTSSPRNQGATYHVNQYFVPRDARGSPENSVPSSYPPPPHAQTKATRKKHVNSKTKAHGKKSRRKDPSKLKRTEKNDTRKRRRKCIYIWISFALLALVGLILGLVLTLTRKASDTPIQTSWLNITGYPPIPTGVATIIRPNAAIENSGCVQPSSMWSCAIPKEQQASIAPNAPDQPNFRVEIRFENTSTRATATNNAKTIENLQIVPVNAVSAGNFIRNSLLQVRDSSPTTEDQTFLGKTTDGNSQPFDGEFTPFSMSFLPDTVLSAKLLRRQRIKPADPFPTATNAIPSPSVNSDGTAAAANLLPFPSAQPLRLFNRGQLNEHYGFYTYFDRSIFLKTTNPNVVVPDDQAGGSPEVAAGVRCTWAQTRFLVQIWTNTGKTTVLLPGVHGSIAASTATPTAGIPILSTSVSSADTSNPPGSFPYPVSITLDRHGGNVDSKLIYCYGMDDNERIVTNLKKIQIEQRGFGGQLVNPSLGLFNHTNIAVADGGPGGIDGGTGGCECQWRNWETQR